jgi:hypothetical protein
MVRLGEHLGSGAPSLSLTFQSLASRMQDTGGAGGQTMGLALIYQFLMAQAATLSYLDTYVVLGIGSTVMFFVSFLLKTNDPKHTEQHMAH